MAEIKSFKALRYNQEIIKNISNVIAPPYDIINKNQQDKLYSSDEYNVIRIDLNKTPGDEKYRIAQKIFQDWQARKILIQDQEESIYPYYQKFAYKRKKYERLGLIVLVKLHEFSEKIILPHEETFSGPKEDRLKLMKACNANLSPIFGIYDDPDRKVDEILDDYISSNKPIIEVKSSDETINIVWKISDKNIIHHVKDIFKYKQILIADGHHRYETSINLHKEETTSKNGYSMFYLSGINQKGLLINPTHRILRGIQNVDKIISSIKSNFINEICNNTVNEDRLLPDEFFVACKNKSLSLKCKIKNKDRDKFYGMSVYAVQNKIIDIFEKLYSEIDFFKSLDDAKSSISSDSICLILPKFVPSDIMKVVLNNDKMPQKSTYFYPKIPTGLLFNKLY
mgnify:FL=1